MGEHDVQAVDAALDLFRQRLSEQEEASERRRQMDESIVARKSAMLVPVRMLLHRLQSMKIVVRNSDRDNASAVGQPLTVEEAPSSPLWSPGVSLLLEHPGVMEIAVPNDTKADGAIRFNLTHPNPHADMLRGPFATPGDACAALAQFIAIQTLSVAREEAG